MNLKSTTLALLGAATFAAPAFANLILHEGFNYTIGTNNPDPDGGLNGGNGLPATNVGGAPAGTSTGFRGAHGTTLDVVAGLSYVQGTNSLVTVGGAGAPNNASWGSDVNIYRNMTTDPFASQRIGGTNTGAFGVDGTSLWISMLANSTSTNGAAFRVKLSGSFNMFVENTATTWTFNPNAAGTVASTGAFTAGQTSLLVIRIDFVAGAGDVFNLWVDPTLGQPLGVANATVTTAADWGGLSQLNFRPSTLNAMTMDEFRMGTTYESVTPFTVIPEPSAFAALAGLAGLGFAASRRRR
jgi:hypothetical protein